MKKIIVSCEGQTRAYVAQALVDFEATVLGRAAKLGAVSVKQAQAEVAALEFLTFRPSGVS